MLNVLEFWQHKKNILLCSSANRCFSTEPTCALAGGYNEAMRHILPPLGVSVVEIERKQMTSGVISASRVREMIGRNELSRLEEFVPPTTLAYVTSDAAAPIRKQLQMKTGVNQ